jgi:hypothetical protein
MQSMCHLLLRQSGTGKGTHLRVVRPSGDREMSAATDNSSEALISNRLLFRMTLAIGVLAALAAGLSILGKQLGENLVLGGNTDSTVVHRIVVGQDVLNLAANTIRFEPQRKSGQAEAVNIYLSWPGLEGYSRRNAAAFSDPRKVDRLIFIDFSQSVMSRDMSGRVEPIYSRLFAGAPADRRLFAGAPAEGPAGLKIHALTRNSGFGDEKLLTGRLPDGAVYAVRCLLPVAPDSSTSADCLRDVKVGRDLTLLYRFSATLLPQWREIEAAVQDFARRRIAR